MHTASALVAREKLFNMRMSAEEWARLEGLAAHYGLNAAGVLRMLVKADVDRIAAAKDGEPRPKDRGRKK